jgi:phosphoribosylformimino-5-aminoimidazole carboxamide ribotide isomerase
MIRLMGRRIGDIGEPFIVGVIDLLDGRAVHARGGDRRTYLPVPLPGAPDGDPQCLAAFYTEHCGLDEIYVADLNAIGGCGWQPDPIRRIGSSVRSLWLDAGITTRDDLSRARALGASRLIVGLETLPSFDALRMLCSADEGDGIALSLDLRDRRILTGGAVAPDVSPAVVAAEAAAIGVRTCIVLDVARVGLAQGCDLETIAAVRAAAPSVTLVAGGGVRDDGDVEALAAIGCNGVLAATALLNGTLAVGRQRR